MGIHELQEDSQSYQGLYHRLQASPPPPPLTLVSAGLLLSHILSPLFAVLQQLFPLLKRESATTITHPWPVADLSGSQLSMVSLDTGEASHRSHYCSPSLEKPCDPNPIYFLLSSFQQELGYTFPALFSLGQTVNDLDI